MTMKAITVKKLADLSNAQVKFVFGHIDGMTSGSEYIVFMEQGGMRIAIQADKHNMQVFFAQALLALDKA
jgi:hypothetical protein